MSVIAGRFALQAGDQRFHARGRRHAGRVAERHMIDARLAEAQRVGDHHGRIDRAFERAAERDRDGADQAEAALRRRGHFSHIVPLVGARLPQVLPGVGFARRHQQTDLGDAEACVQIGQGALDRADIGAGRLVMDPARRSSDFKSSLASANCGTTLGLE